MLFQNSFELSDPDSLYNAFNIIIKIYILRVYVLQFDNSLYNLKIVKSLIQPFQMQKLWKGDNFKSIIIVMNDYYKIVM